MEDENETHYTPRMDYLAMRKLSITPNKLKKKKHSFEVGRRDVDFGFQHQGM
jgi:hypothetical protein